MLIDTHSHLNFRAFDDDREAVIKRTLDNDIWLINASSNFFTSQKAVEIAEQYQKGVYASIGLHPINIKQTELNQANRPEDALEDFFDYERYKELADSPKVVAIGEIGLDFWQEPKNKEKSKIFKQNQEEIFLKQLELAKDLNLPVIFHCRKAHNDLIRVFNSQPAAFKPQGVIHCFTGNLEQAQKYLELGFYLGFNGIIFKLDLDEIIKKIPLDKILLETDCPFLTPPLACRSSVESGIKAAADNRNEPMNVKYIAQRIAELKKESFGRVAEITTQNALDLFRL